MNPKYDINAADEDDDFEATHRDLEKYVRGNEQLNAGLGRLVWERKVMRRIKSLETRVGRVEDGQHSTIEIAAIAQLEVGPARKFVDGLIQWRRKIFGYLLSAVATGVVAWFLTKHGVSH
jgi:hypothetical protein